MFSLKVDLLSPILVSARKFSLNGRRKPPPASDRDARELHRIRSELRAARIEQEARAVQHRYHVF